MSTREVCIGAGETPSKRISVSGRDPKGAEV